LKLLDLTLPSPAENLACDEALLDQCEDDATHPGVLRFWESPRHFVVVGYANKVATEVNLEACRPRGIPVLRRCTGGGTVVQGPGCLNFALILSAPSENVTDTNRVIMERNRAAIASLWERPSGRDRRGHRARKGAPTITFDGHTDLALDGRKFSGNSQRRRKRCILFHGTFLLDFDLTLVEELLRFPSKQPSYRQGRTHRDFLTNLSLPAETVKNALRKEWGATEPFPSVPTEPVAQLVAEKYGTRAWNEKF